MYIAGLNLGLTHNQGVEGLVAFTTTAQLLTTARLFSRGFKVSETEAGSIKPIPPTFLAKAISPVHITSTLAAPILYLLGVGLNRLEQPQWLLRLSFPASLDDMLGERGKAVVRVAACIGSICCFTLLRSSVAHLGPQLHFLGVREKARVVSEGPYAYVRHPLYSYFLVQPLLLAPMFWSYVPLIMLPISAGLAAVKIPIEEKIIEDDLSLGPSYLSYKEKVRAKMIPYIW